MQAWQHAQTINSWHENLPSDEVPPREIWQLNKKIDQWFENIRKKREEKLSGDAPEGTLAEAQAGKDVTLRNDFAKMAMEATRNTAAPYDEIHEI